MRHVNVHDGMKGAVRCGLDNGKLQVLPGQTLRPTVVYTVYTEYRPLVQTCGSLIQSYDVLSQDLQMDLLDHALFLERNTSASFLRLLRTKLHMSAVR